MNDKSGETKFASLFTHSQIVGSMLVSHKTHRVFLGSSSLFASFFFCRFVFVFTEGVWHVKDGLDVNAAACGRWLSVTKWQQRFHLNLMILMTKYIYESFTFLYSISSRLRKKIMQLSETSAYRRPCLKLLWVSSLIILGLPHTKYLHHYYHLYSRLDCSVLIMYNLFFRRCLIGCLLQQVQHQEDLHL